MFAAAIFHLEDKRALLQLPYLVSRLPRPLIILKGMKPFVQVSLFLNLTITLFMQLKITRTVNANRYGASQVNSDFACLMEVQGAIPV